MTREGRDARHQPPRDDEHKPVLLESALTVLAIGASDVCVDATFGRGGHSAAILSRLGPDGRLLALDRDPDAVAVARTWQDPRFAIEHARFSQLAAALARHGIDAVDAILFDLGVSSPQLDNPERGFSFRDDGPLDMRMDPTSGFSAREWLLQASETNIAEVLKNYGEERFAVPIAKAIVARRGDRGADAFATTGELARVVAGVVRSRQKGAALAKDPATRSFQALRILVNQELEELALGLDVAVAHLRPGGRLAVISFHSLEDRIVKRFIAEESGRNAARDPIRGTVLPGARVRLRSLGRILPGEADVAANPRARSAVLRAAVRV